MSLYIRLSTQVLTDAKLLCVSSDAFTLWVKGLLYAKEHLTDGFVPDGALPLLMIGISDQKSAIESLTAGGDDSLWHRVEGGHTVGADRWAHWQTTKADVEEKQVKERERKAEWRRKKAEQVDASVTNLSQWDTEPCPANVPSTEPEPEHRVIAQSQSHSSEHRAQETGGITAPLETPAVAAMQTAGADGEFMAVTWLCEELGVALAPAQRSMAAKHIAFTGRELAKDGDELLHTILAKAQEDRARGEPVNAWYIADGKWRNDGGESGTGQRKSISPAHDRLRAGDEAIAAALARRGIRGTVAADEANERPLPAPGPIGRNRGIPDGLRTVGATVLDGRSAVRPG